MNFIRKLPIPKELKEEFPVSEKDQKIRGEKIEELKKIFRGEEDNIQIVLQSSDVHGSPVRCSARISRNLNHHRAGRM